MSENSYVRELTRAEIDGLYGKRGLSRDGVDLQTRATGIPEDAVDVENRTVALSFSSEAEYERIFGIEILDHSPTSIRAGRLQNNVPICLDHDLSRRVGALVSFELGEDRVGRGLAKLSRSRPEAEHELQDAADGIPSQISVGYFVHKMVLQEERDDGPDVYRVTDWEPFEVSFVSAAADQTVGVGRSVELETPGEDSETPEMAEETKSVETPAVDVQAIEARAADEARKAERARCDLIRTYAKNASKLVPDAPELERQFIESGRSGEEFLAAINERMGNEPVRAPKPEDDGIGMTDKEARSWSILNAVRFLASPHDPRAREAAAFEIEASRAVEDEYHRPAKGLFMPTDVMRRDLTSAGISSGGALVGNQLSGSMVELLRNRQILNTLGATYISGLKGDFSMSKQTGGATGYWVGEGSAVTESAQTFGQITASPKTVGAFTDITRKMLQQSTPDVEAVVKADLAKVLAGKRDYAAFHGSGASGEPMGLLATTGIGSVALGDNGAAVSNVLAIDIEKQILCDNADIGSMAYVTNTKIKSELKQTFVNTTGGETAIWTESGEPGVGLLNGYRAYTSNHISSTLTKGNNSDCSALILGVWPELLVFEWGGGLDLNVDDKTLSTSGGLRLVALQDVDYALRHPESFAACVDARDAA